MCGYVELGDRPRYERHTFKLPSEDRRSAISVSVSIPQDIDPQRVLEDLASIKYSVLRGKVKKIINLDGRPAGLYKTVEWIYQCAIRDLIYFYNRVVKCFQLRYIKHQVDMYKRDIISHNDYFASLRK